MCKYKEMPCFNARLGGYWRKQGISIFARRSFWTFVSNRPGLTPAGHRPRRLSLKPRPRIGRVLINSPTRGIAGSVWESWETNRNPMLLLELFGLFLLRAAQRALF
jgi:hypothetical protein